MQSTTSSFVSDVKSALFQITMFSGVLIVSLAAIIGNLFLAVLIVWGVCAVVFGIVACVMVWRLRLAQFNTQLHINDPEAAQHLLADSDPITALDDEPATSSPKRALDKLPAYCTPLEMLNQFQVPTEGDVGVPGIQTITATVLESSEDDCTFATSPFTSPPIYTMEIFISKEETVFHDDLPVQPSFSTPSPLELEQEESDARAAAFSRELTKLIQLCEISIMESNMRDTQLI